MKVGREFPEADALMNELMNFQYKDKDESVAVTNQLVHDRIVAAITQALVAKGFSEVDSDLDLSVTRAPSSS